MQMKPSQQKPWRDLYPKEIPDIERTNCTINEYLWKCNEGHLSDVALEYYGRKISYQEMKDNIDRTAKALAAAGLKDGDIAVICAVMIPETIYLFYAMNLLGIIPNMVDPRTSAEGMHEYIEEVNATFTCTLDVCYDKMQQAVRNTGVNKVLVISPANSLPPVVKALYKLKSHTHNTYDSKAVNWNTFLKTADGYTGTLTCVKDSQHPAVMLHTGGTTGIPKCVLLSAQTFNVQTIQLGYFRATRGEITLNIMPPFIAYGFINGVHVPLCSGSRSVLIPQFDPARFGSLLLKYKPQYMSGVPVHYQMLARDPKMKGKDLSFLRTLGCGGDSINVGAEEEVNRFLKEHHCPYPLTNGYGMTEVAAAATAGFDNHVKAGSVGFPLCYTTVGIFKPGTDEELDYNQEGEICFTGPGNMLGYYNNPEETQKVMFTHKDGQVWVHSGDIGVMDEDGYVFMRSRIKRVVVRHDGFKVYATTIENVAGKHPDVYTCSVVGVKDKDHLQGNLPVLFFTAKEGCKTPQAELEKSVGQLCRQMLPSYVAPVAYIQVEELPYTGISKVDYRALEAQAAALQL